MPLTLPKRGLQPIFHIDVKIMEILASAIFKHTVKTNRNMPTLVSLRNMLLVV